MDIILQLIGSIAIIVFGVVLIGGGALGESIATYFSGIAIAVVGVGLILSKAATAIGITIPDFTFTISGNSILIALTGIVGIVIVLAGLKVLFK